MTTRPQVSTAHREDWDRNVFAGLEELRERGASLDAWAGAGAGKEGKRLEPPELVVDAATTRFDLCVDMGPPPRLA